MVIYFPCFDTPSFRSYIPGNSCLFRILESVWIRQLGVNAF